MKKPYATALRSTLVAVLLGGAVVQAHAITITTTRSQYEPGGVRYHFVVNDWSSGTIGGPNTCVSDDPRHSVCRVSLGAYERPGSRSVGWFSQYWEVSIFRESSTMGQLLFGMQSRGFQLPLTASIFVPTSKASNENCITFAYSTIGPSIGGTVIPFGPCTRVAIPILQCDIQGDPVINHKNLPDNALEGATASTQLNVLCRGPASVTVSASRTNTFGVRLRDDNSLYSKITINGKDATEGINLPVSEDLATPINITSTLVTRGTVTPGAFSGFTVITVSPP
ncbi:MAG: hypothetical protein ACRC1I_21215 [Pseudomonas proteolytica]|uniref:MrpH family fimbial adhesin n=1 Tax=Pseudomonas proteolytica TaxID=219574 RepID=UPI003F407329